MSKQKESNIDSGSKGSTQPPETVPLAGLTLELQPSVKEPTFFNKHKKKIIFGGIIPGIIVVAVVAVALILLKGGFLESRHTPNSTLADGYSEFAHKLHPTIAVSSTELDHEPTSTITTMQPQLSYIDQLAYIESHGFFENLTIQYNKGPDKQTSNLFRQAIGNVTYDGVDYILVPYHNNGYRQPTVEECHSVNTNHSEHKIIDVLISDSVTEVNLFILLPSDKVTSNIINKCGNYTEVPEPKRLFYNYFSHNKIITFFYSNNGGQFLLSDFITNVSVKTFTYYIFSITPFIFNYQ